MNTYLNYNGNLLQADQPILRHPRDFRPGDGLFETMRVSNGKIVLADHHFERLHSGMRAMLLDRTPLFDTNHLQEMVMQVCSKNGHLHGARVRLTVFRGQNSQAEHIIETWPLENEYVFNDPGLIIGIFPEAKKTDGEFSSYKTINYHPYRDAAAFASKQQWDDCLVLNTHDHVCDSSISNIFWIKNETLHTPPLSEGCVAGVMRSHLLTSMAATRFQIEEKPLSLHELSTADEVFLTNVIRGIRPVDRFENCYYTHRVSREVFTLLVAPLINA
ncbi:MAG: aminotransferase class IV [Chitinophagaceae bacterium]